MNITDIPQIPNTNADKFKLTPNNGFLKEIEGVYDSSKASEGTFDICLKSGDNGVEASLTDYSETLFSDIFSSGGKSQSELWDHFTNAKRALSEAFSESRFSIAGYEELCKILDEACNSERIIRMKSSLGQMNNNEIAKHIGGMGKKLDEAFAKGYLTEEQFDSLNKQFEDYATSLAVFCKMGEAKWAAFRTEYTESRLGQLNGANKSYEDILADRQAAMEEFLEKNPIDMNLIMSMINSVRYG